MSEHAGEIRVAIVGVGNCASSLVQGVQYYHNADENASVPGLMHVKFGPYHVRDVEFVAAFDVDAKKVGFDLSEAIFASENNTIKIADVPPTNVTVQRGPTLDGIGKYYADTIEVSDSEPVDVVKVLKDNEVDVFWTSHKDSSKVGSVESLPTGEAQHADVGQVDDRPAFSERALLAQRFAVVHRGLREVTRPEDRGRTQRSGQGRRSRRGRLGG